MSAQVADTLDSPSLFPGGRWAEEFTIPTGISNVTFQPVGTNLAGELPFSSGHYFTATLPLDANGERLEIVEKYYRDALAKKHWTGAFLPTSRLTFPAFDLYTDVADGVCGHEEGFVGYQEKMIRLVEISGNRRPCNPPFLTPDPTGAQYFTDYQVYISDPTPLRTLTEYMHAHPAR